MSFGLLFIYQKECFIKFLLILSLWLFKNQTKFKTNQKYLNKLIKLSKKSSVKVNPDLRSLKYEIIHIIKRSGAAKGSILLAAPLMDDFIFLYLR